MPNQAHEFFEKELKETLTELFDHIYDTATEYEKWFGNRAEECEWQDRDGFWSYNNGGLEMSLMASSTILSEGHDAPCINEWYESYNNELVEEAEKNDDYQEWKKENPDSTVMQEQSGCSWGCAAVGCLATLVILLLFAVIIYLLFREGHIQLGAA